MTDRIDTAQERAKLAALEGHTPGPWWTDAQYSGHQMGCSIIAANPHAGPMPGNPTRGQVAFATAILNTDARKCEANSRLIAAAPDLKATLAAALDELDRLREALEPFAHAAQYCYPDFEDDYSPNWALFFICGDFRRARAALSGEGET